MFQGRQQARAHGVTMLGDGTEPAVITAKALEERGQVVDAVDLRDDFDQCVNEMAALRRHGDREQVPHLGMLDEQVGVEEQRQFVTVHRDMGEALPQPGDVQQSRPFSPSPPADRSRPAGLRPKTSRAVILSASIARKILMQVARANIGQLTDI